MNLKSVLVGVAVIGAVVALPFLGLEIRRYFEPRHADIDREVFERTKGYNDGMVRDLAEMHRQYVAATPEQKLALRATILHRFSVYPEEKLPEYLRQFYVQLRSEAP